MQKEKRKQMKWSWKISDHVKKNESYKVENDNSSINPAPHHLFPVHAVDFPIPKYLPHHFL